jgi:hypothetical protein
MNTVKIKILELMPDYVLDQVVEVKSNRHGIPLDYQIRRSLKAGACEIVADKPAKVVAEKPAKQVEEKRSFKKKTRKSFKDEE